ncbi:MAG: hypothetical protein HY689_05620 [Chloroflexi bacterium]|nr:hypothetical protein [Chloroflexota bacterium]
MTGQHLLILPIVLPLAGAIPAALLAARAGAWVGLVTTVLTLAASAAVLAASVGGPQVYWVGGWAPPHGIALVADRFSAALALTTAAVAAASALHTLVSGEAVAHRRLYHPLFLLLLTALGGVFLTGDLFNLYVFMEIVIISSFALVALADRPVSAEVTFKYAVLSALGSLLLLVSVALVYAGVGTLNMADIAQRVRNAAAPPFWPIVAALMLAAFLLKGAIFPFHFWQPDAHAAAPSPVSAMLSGIMVKIGFYGIVRMETLIFPDAPVLLVLAPLGGASAVFGGLAALANPNLKRLLAYSTIANMGFILLALGWGGPAGMAAAMVNAVNHALLKASLFLSGGYVTERLGEQALPRLGGLAHLTPGGTLAFGLGALALAGLPPLSGFLSKLTLFQAGLAAGDPALLAVAVGASGLGIAYSLRAFVLAYWGETPPWAVERWARRAAHRGTLAAPLLLVFLVVALGIWPGPFMGLAAAAAAELGQPDIYITAVLEGGR